MNAKNPRKIYVSYEAVCKECNGEGGTSNAVCDLCAGTGYVNIEKDIFIGVTHSETKPIKWQGKQVIKF
ncbi:MAG: hypothetical protein RBR40_08435 [Tenuifilaceae bacterium]|nr:hypothetical protein [Tenuifilaceae bacterium]